jgi:hypothetical protein
MVAQWASPPHDRNIFDALYAVNVHAFCAVLSDWVEDEDQLSLDGQTEN